MPRIERLYAYVGEETPGEEGVVGARIPGMGTVPLVGADKDRIVSLRSFAVLAKECTGRPVKLVCFESRVDLEDI